MTTKEYLPQNNLNLLKGECMIEELMKKIVAGEITTRAALESLQPKIESKVHIVIAPRGWIFIGYTHKEDNNLVIERANVIRVWGTTKGLGELITGPTKDTKLDQCGTTRIPLDAIIALIDCEESKWETKI